MTFTAPPSIATPSKNTRTVLIVMGVLLIVALAVLLYLLGEQKAAEVRAEGPLRLESVAVITGPGTGESPRFSKPLGVAFGPSGQVYVADSGNDRVCVFDADGDHVTSWGGLGVAKPLPGYPATWKPGRLNYPADVDVDSQGRVYVADFHNDRISVFSADGEHLRNLPDESQPVGRGSSGKDGAGIAVTGVAAEGGRVYATDTYQVFVFDENGELLSQIGMPGSQTDLDHPSGIDVSADGNLVVADSNHVRVASFTDAGLPVWATSEPKSAPARSGEDRALGLPRGLTIMADGRTLVADAVGQCLAIIDSTGRVEDTLGNRGLEPGEFNFPTDVDVMGDLVVVADKENDRVQILRLVGKGSPSAPIAPTEVAGR